MKKLHLFFLLFFSTFYIFADAWDDINSKLIPKTNSVAAAAAPQKVEENNPQNLLLTTNIWIVVKTKKFSVFSHNHDFSLLIKNFAENSLTSIAEKLYIDIPKNFNSKIYIFDSNDELNKYINDAFQGAEIERWFDGQSLLAYRFSDKKKLRKNLLNNDLPYLITAALLNCIDPNDNIPFTLKTGFAASFQQSVSNNIKRYSAALLDDKDIWLDYKTLFSTTYDPFDEPEIIDNAEAQAAIWAMFIRSKLEKKQTANLLFNLANSGNLKKSFANAFQVSMFDTMPRIEERAHQWLKEKFPVKRKNVYALSQTNKKIIILAFAGFVLAFFIILFYKWITDLIN